MPESYGKLDGLRDIIHPAIPAQTDTLLWLAALLCLATLLWLFYLYARYRRRPLARARRLYRQLSNQGNKLNAARSGDYMISILRLYPGTNQLQAISVAGFNRQEWQGLLDDCNQLRFSGADRRPDTVSRAMDQLARLLWPAR